MSAVGRRRLLRWLGAGALAAAVVGLPAEARAAGVEVTTTLSSDRVEVGESVYLQVEVESDAGEIGQPRLGGLEHVEVTARGTSSGMSVSIGGGQRVQRSTKTFTYILAPQKPGEYTIDVAVEVGGELRRPASKPKLIASGEPIAAVVESGKAGDAPEDPDAEVVVWPVVDKASAYVGEQVVYELQIWERVNSNLSVTETPTFKDFWSEDLLPANAARRRSPERRYIAGVPYRVHQTMLRALFPQKAGTLTIGGPKIQMQPMVGLFGGGGAPKTFLGRGLTVEVKPLPAKGQPPGFRPNNVGKLNVSAELDRHAIRQGEAVKLSVRIAGTGNIALVELPELPAIPGLRSYEAKPQTPEFVGNQRKLEGSRVYTMLLVAEDAGELVVPAIELPYFDPEAERYVVAKTKPLALTVEPDPEAAAALAKDTDRRGASAGTAAAGVGEDAELLAPPIASASLERTTPRSRWLTRERWWAGTLAAPAVLGLAWAATKLAGRWAPDEQRRARTRELARRRTLLAEAGATVESGDGFYPKLAAVLQAAAVGRAGGEGVGLTRERLMRLLASNGVSADELQELRALLDECDAARFGAGSGDVDQRRGHLERARKLLDLRGWGPG